MSLARIEPIESRLRQKTGIDAKIEGLGKMARAVENRCSLCGSSELDAFLKVFDRQPFERQTSNWGAERFGQLEKGERN
ncbi:hypothetical protein [Kamptonema formosum]|uniref:hypothetical protein n=1 Tax=Kamptonema formosum TaxID=331992 RepID=UPI00034A4B08|nr:hypothetical protein [Oscillatoria sp. PCC 10802]